MEDDAPAVWERLSRETRGLLEGIYAARAGLPAHHVAGADGDAGERLTVLVRPLRDAVLRASGGADRISAFGVSAARLLDRTTAYVLLLPDFGEERIVREEEWRPAHAIAFTYESREWLIDVGRTAALSAEVELPDPLGEIR